MTPIKSPTMPSVIDGSAAAEFRRSFNAAHFEFRHNLAGHPLFSIARLAELAERMTAVGAGHHVVAFSVTRKTPARKFDQLARHEGARETLSRIETGTSWLKLSFVQEYDPQYRGIHDQILEDAADCSGLPLRQALRWSSMTILLSSPGIITPYHIDHESNLLFQIAGEKEVWLFDPRDVRALREDEIENFYVGNVNAADFRLAAQPLGCLYRLAPGVAVHNPPLGPHWVRNGNGVSVSVSLNFSLRSSEQRARVYQMNYYLRRLGWHPSPPSGFAAPRLDQGLGDADRRGGSAPEPGATAAAGTPAAMAAVESRDGRLLGQGVMVWAVVSASRLIIGDRTQPKERNEIPNSADRSIPGRGEPTPEAQRPAKSPEVHSRDPASPG